MPILDLRTAPPDTIATTVCVIGSGAAGGVVASKLALAGIDVLLIEAGALSFDTSRRDTIADLDGIAADGNKLRFYEQLGGSSNRWGGRVAPFDAIDFECRHWVPSSGWPFSFADLLPYYEKGSKLLGVSDQAWFSCGSFPTPALLPEGVELRCYQWARSRFNLRQPLDQLARRADSQLTILLNAPVQRLVTNQNRTEVRHAEIADPRGNRVVAKARLFVLAAGAIQTPRLLLNSAQDHSAGLGDEHGNVGRYFATHPRANVATLVLPKPIRTTHSLFRTRYLSSGQRRDCLALSRAVQEKHGLLNHHLQLLPFLEERVVKLFEEVKRTKVTQTKLFDRRSRVSGMLPGLALASYRLMERATAVQSRARCFALRGFLDQYPDPENRIYLSDQADRHGSRMAAISWRFSASDRDSVMASLAYLDRRFRDRGVGEINVRAASDSVDWPMRGIHSHFMGTTRMGENPGSAVTDKHGRLFHTLNLFIAGPSLFPTSGSANPFFTIVALSLRLADRIMAELDSRSEIISR